MIKIICQITNLKVNPCFGHLEEAGLSKKNMTEQTPLQLQGIVMVVGTLMCLVPGKNLSIIC